MVMTVTSPAPLQEHLSGMPLTAMRDHVEAKRRAFFVVLSTPEKADSLDQELIRWASSQQVYIRARPVRRETFSRGPLSIAVQVYGTGQRARRFEP